MLSAMFVGLVGVAMLDVPDRAVQDALKKAEDNRASLSRALEKASPAQKPALRFLIANMGDPDLTTLKGDWLLEHVRLAQEAVAKVPWGTRIPERMFLNHVLPYANVTEERDDWREMFQKKYLAKAIELSTPEKVALWMNEHLFADYNVKYHPTKRRIADQAPSESIKLGYASCTGLSIMLIDALRSVGVPARFVGVAMWFDNSGNHTWVEYWDGSEWKYIGAAEPSEPNQTWFTEKAAKAVASDPKYAVWAAQFEKSKDSFPVGWRRVSATIPAENVTARYTAGKLEVPKLDPVPGEFKLLEGTFVVTGDTTVSVDGPEWLTQGVDQLLGFWLDGSKKAGKGSQSTGMVVFLDPALAKGSYTAEVRPDHCKIAVADKEAWVRAETLLKQLAKVAKEPRPGTVRIPCCQVADPAPATR